MMLVRSKGCGIFLSSTARLRKSIILSLKSGSLSLITPAFTTENVEVKLPDDFDSWTEQSFDMSTDDIPYDAELDVESGAESAE